MKTTTPFFLLPAALLAVLATGCVSHRISPPPFPPGPDNQPVYQISSKESAMKVQLSVTPANEASKTLAEGAKTVATTALRNARYQVVSAGTADLDLALAATQTTFNNAANKFFTLDGSLDVRLADSTTGNVLAQTTLRDRAGPELGRDAAAVALSGKIAPALSQWIRATVTPDQISLAASMVQVSSINAHPGEDAGFVKDFVSTVSGLKGVVRVETIGVDSVAHVATFRLLWRTTDVPEGIIPAIATAFPELKFVL